MASWRPRLIPRKVLQGYRKTASVDEDGAPLPENEIPFEIENASYQPAKGNDLLAVPSGYRDTVIYRVFTTTPLKSVEEGSDGLADEIEILGKRYKVIKLSNWDVGVQSHYEALVSQLNER